MNIRELVNEHPDKIVYADDGCWLWTGATAGSGYGVVVIDGENVYIHRIAAGDIAEGKQVNHHCDTKNCCNPDHVYVGTVRENMEDAIDRGQLPEGGPGELFDGHREEGWEESGIYNSGGGHPSAVLSSDERKEVRRRYRTEDVAQQDLADEFDCDRATISRVVREK